jgi:hypothetical protein
MKAPNGQPTKLTERQWVQVRTPFFKEWFGDWETEARIEGIKQSKPIDITINNPVNQKEAEKIAGSFRTLQSKSDGKPTELPIGTIGKIIGHKGFDVSQIIHDIPTLYNMSILAWTDVAVQ